MDGLDLSGRTLGEFVLLEKITEGGYGAIYRCTQPTLRRDVVVKVLHERRRFKDAGQERFMREAQLASRLDHPYAAHVYAFGVEAEDGLLWIAMEMVHGVTLSRWLETHGPMPLEQFVPFFDCVALVVQAAHDRGIVHRDLKPSNVMVIEHAGQLIPKLLDFGIAKAGAEFAPAEAELEAAEAEGQAARRAAEGATARIRLSPPDLPRTQTQSEQDRPAGDRLTRSGAGMGSSAYMSPEQWRNARDVGPATDIYSLGVVAYQALTGRLPFPGENTGEFFRRHVHEEVPPLADFSPELNGTIRRALAKAPEDRHGSVLALASDLRAALRASEREQLRTSAQQWADRHREPGLLWGGNALSGLERWTQRAPSGALSELECSFVAASQRRGRRLRWARRSLVVLLAVGALGALQYRAEMQARAAEAVAEATVTQAAIEQGRSALLHGEPEAIAHLLEAYRHDRSPATAFMLARALQPRLAEQARFASSSGRMWSAVFSPDGKRVVTTDDKNAQVWDAQTYRLLFTLLHGDVVYQVVYSQDGTRFFTACGDGAVRIWDAATGTLVRELRRAGSKPRYYLLALSPGDKLVAAIDAKGDFAHVWDSETGAPLAEIRNDGMASAALAFSADGRWLATTGGDDVHVVDTHSWRPALTVRGPRINRLAFDPTGARLVTGAATGDAAIWEIPSGARLHHLRDVGEPVDAVAFSPDGQLVATASRDGVEQVWQPSSGKLLSQFNPRRSKILAVEFDRTSKLLLAAGTDGSVVVADAELGMPITVLEGPQNIVWSAHFDAESRRVVGASWDGTARVWDAAPPYRKWAAPPVSDYCGIVMRPESDRRFVAVGCRPDPTRIWDTSRNVMVAELPSVSLVEGDFTSAFPAVSDAGDRAAIARGNEVEVYDVPGGRLLRTITHGAAVNAVAFDSGRDIVSGAVDGSVLVTRDSGAQVALPKAAGGIDVVAFTADGRIIVADAARHLRFFDRGGAILAQLEIPVRVLSLRIEGTRLVALPTYIGNAASPLLLELDHYRIVNQLQGHVGQVFSARWVAGGRIITAGGDGTARLWDGATGRLLQVYRGSSRLLADATLAPDGLVIAGGADGLLRFWDQGSGRLLWTLSAHRSQLIGIRIEGDDIVTRGFAGELSRWTLPSPTQVIGACADHERCVIVQP